MMAPPDGEDFALHPVALIVCHVADRRGSAQPEQCGGEEKEEPRWGAGEGAGAAVAWGGRRCDVATPSILVAVRRFLQKGCGSYIGKDG
jgi:hypothetical protein